MERVKCSVCDRIVNGRVPAGGDGSALKPYRHVPPDTLGTLKAVEGGGWMGHNQWCRGSYYVAKAAVEG